MCAKVTNQSRLGCVVRAVELSRWTWMQVELQRDVIECLVLPYFCSERQWVESECSFRVHGRRKLD